MTKTFKDDPNEITRALKSYAPGEVPTPVWHEIQRLNGSIIFDSVPYRFKGDDIEIYSPLRSKDDPYFGGQHCLPGKVLIGSDRCEEDVLKRLIDTELQGLTIKEPKHIETYMRVNSRAVEMVALYAIEVVEGGNDEFWFPLNSGSNTFTVNYHEAVGKALSVINNRE